MFRNRFALYRATSGGVERPLSIEQLEDRTLLSGANFGFAHSLGVPGRNSAGTAIAADLGGNFYAAGAFSGAVDFDPGPASDVRDGGSGRIYIAKYSPTADLFWVRTLDGAAPPFGPSAIKLDDAGGVYVTGRFDGTVDFDPGPNTFNLTGPGLFALKLTSSGDFVWATKVRGTEDVSTPDLTLDNTGNVYVVGTEAVPGTREAVITKLNSAGNIVFEFSFGTQSAPNTFWGSHAAAVAADQLGNIYVGGAFEGTPDFDPGPGVVTRQAERESDIYVLKFDSAGELLWMDAFGGPFSEGASDVAIDGQGSVLVTGGFSGTIDFNPGPGTLSLMAGNTSDAFVLKLDSGGNFIWAKNVGDAEGTAGGEVITFDANNNVYTGGTYVTSSDFDPGMGQFILRREDGRNTFLVKLDSSGNFVWVRDLKGGFVFLHDLALNGFGSLYMTGEYVEAEDLDPGPGIFSLPSTGNCGPACHHAFVAKLVQRHDTTVTGTDVDTPAEVRQYDAETGALLYSFFPYGDSFAGGVRVASGDVNGDGFSDIITVPGPGFGPLVKIYDGLTKRLLPYPLGQFYAYSSSNTVPGFHIAVGDVNMDGRADIITAPGPGLSGLVRVFSGRDRALLHQFFVYSGSTGGVHVAAGDVNGDGRADIITAPASQRGPLVYVFNGIDRSVIRSFAAYESGFTGGVFVAAGYVDNDSRADIITGSGAGRGPLVRVWSGSNGALQKSFNAYESTYTGGVRVATTDADDDDLADIITAPGKNHEPFVRIFDGQENRAIDQFFAADQTFTGGLFVAGGRGR